MKLDIAKGELLVSSARKYVKQKLGLREEIDEEKLKGLFPEKSGIFTSIHTYPGKRLRGCIGFPQPVYPLWKALLLSAEEAAFGDPRFPPLNVEELKNVVFEVTVLTPPEKIVAKHPEELPMGFKVGKHGLIAKGVWGSGLLLPQVAVEYKWNEEEFLSNTCVKAGLPEDEWRKGNVEFYKFSGVIFSELTPEGRIIEEKISREEI